MKKSAKLAIFAGISITVIIGGLALFVHFKLSEIEKNETGQESAEQIANEALEVISGKEPHSEEENTHLDESSESESNEYETTSSEQEQLEDKIITPKDNDKLIDIKKGESFVVKLDSSYEWRIDIDNKTVVDSDYSDIRYSGSQGVYRAHNSGQAILTGIGDPLCRLSEPPCASPSILFQLNINVK